MQKNIILLALLRLLSVKATAQNNKTWSVKVSFYSSKIRFDYLPMREAISLYDSIFFAI
jgi:hypothetical protein